jgi:hypothetical protein
VIVGALDIARFLRGALRPTPAKRAAFGSNFAMHAATVNGGPAWLALDGARVVAVVSLVVTADGISTVHIQVNPDKLQRIGEQWAAAEHGEPFAVAW